MVTGALTDYGSNILGYKGYVTDHGSNSTG